MIVFKDLPAVEPYQQFNKDYLDAEKANQPLIHAIAISSFNKTLNEVESRFVNLKYIEGEEWIFFSNYNSPKAKSFQSHGFEMTLLWGCCSLRRKSIPLPLYILNLQNDSQLHSRSY